MKIDRRSFLGLGLGAAAGVAISPPGVKITDDLSIWTQNWPWTPVPTDGEVTFEDSVCSLCQGNCGISVRKIDDRPVKIEGRKGYPVNDGGICLHGISGLQYLYDPARIKTPLVKKGNGFTPASWEEAAALVAEKLTDLKDKGKSDGIACVSGTGDGSVPGLLKRLLFVLGSANFHVMESMDQSWEKVVTKMQVLGHGKTGYPGFDLENSDFILSLGCGLIEGWGSPVNNFLINAGRKDRGVKLVQVEPRLSNTAAGADKWVPVKPGSEADLALGICNVLIQEKLYDTSYISGPKNGFALFSEMLAEKYTPEKVAAVTGLDAETITALAHDFSKASHPIALAGRGRGDAADSTREIAAAYALNCLVGNINKKGGVWTMAPSDYLTWPEAVMDAAVYKKVKRAAKKGGKSVSQLFSDINTDDESPVDALLVLNANPAFALKDTAAAVKALEKVPFIVSFSSFMDETTSQADVILPVNSCLEKLEDLPGARSMTKSIVGLAKPVVGPVFDTKNTGDAVLMIAAKMESATKSFPWESYEACLESLTGDLWEKLSEEGFAQSEIAPPGAAPTADFSLLFKKAEAIAPEGDNAAFPLTLVPANNVRISGGSVAPSPFAVKTLADTTLKGNMGFVEINPETAKEYRLKQGSEAILETPKGSAKVKVHLFDGIMPGVVAMAKGLGHAAGENPYVGGKGVNINELIGPVMDAASGLDAAWGIKAKISRT